MAYSSEAGADDVQPAGRCPARKPTTAAANPAVPAGIVGLSCAANYLIRHGLLSEHHADIFIQQVSVAIGIHFDMMCNHCFAFC